MARFVVLTHDYPELHWDFLLEAGAACRTWRLMGEPGAGRVVSAEAIADHRLLYLEYEGPVRGDRGSVARWDGGEFEFVCDGEEEMVVRLAGGRLAGECRLVRVEGAVWRAAFGAGE